MKDAKGHGSNARGAHAERVDQIGRPVLRPNVIKHILDNPDGFTVALNGKVPTNGYQVAIPGHQLAAPIGTANNGEAQLQSWAMANANALKQAGYVGGYLNRTTGNYEIEPSQNIKSRNAAVRVGIARNQVSIWNHRKSREIPTGGTGR
jgi:hypothetical protein